MTLNSNLTLIIFETLELKNEIICTQKIKIIELKNKIKELQKNK